MRQHMNNDMGTHSVEEKMNQDEQLKAMSNLSADFMDRAPSFTFDELWERYTAQSSSWPQFTITNRKLRTALIVILLVIAMGSGLAFPAVGEAIRSIPFIDFLLDKGGFPSGLKRIDEKGLDSASGVESSDNGVVIRMESVYYDGTQFMLNYNVTLPERLPALTEDKASVYYKLVFDDKQADLNSIYTHAFTITGDHSFAGTTLFNFGSADMPETLKLHMLVDRVGDVSGNWDLPIILDKSKSDNLSETFRPRIKGSYQGVSFTVEKLLVAPAVVRMVLETDDSFETRNWNIQLRDDKGTFLEPGGGSGDQNGQVIADFSGLSAINPHPEYLTLTLSNRNGSSSPNQQLEKTRMNLPIQVPLTVNREGAGDFTITSIEYGEQETKVYYTLSKPVPGNAPFYFADRHKEFISTKRFPERIAKDTLSYMAVFPALNLKDNPVLVVDPESAIEASQAYELNIPLTKMDEGK
ncbi:DUF4179 domain-containing protein [Paenibacillus sp. HN-1]|uniref:DUF4179 domain-containing protein n=1 Tax=Paenibacillus TaxID=44249 RepID=UPI001CA84C29|nr:MULTISPECIES: DUF4179 domain-containing protein [Paenibacillus]MBY9079238.1 DUF4179 domain-containing protein [Paenibacillus sp. CGMCC 1.18879]MBY9086961.1 DUF4179 domain-containing protein [Paenibacillus sinensis]